MTSLEDLRKALEERAVSEKEICTTYGIPLGHKKVLLDHPRWIKISDALDLFSVFQKDYGKLLKELAESNLLCELQASRISGLETFKKQCNGKVIVSRKQLSELISNYPSYRHLSKHPTIQELTDFILVRDDHFEKLKELLEATKK